MLYRAWLSGQRAFGCREFSVADESYQDVSLVLAISSTDALSDVAVSEPTAWAKCRTGAHGCRSRFHQLARRTPMTLTVNDIQRLAAFHDRGAGGNPAGVAIVESMPDESTMRALAAEIGYSETAFASPEGDAWRVRYFSPESEVPFCGHATIALGAALAAREGDATFELRSERRGDHCRRACGPRGAERITGFTIDIERACEPVAPVQCTHAPRLRAGRSRSVVLTARRLRWCNPPDPRAAHPRCARGNVLRSGCGASADERCRSGDDRAGACARAKRVRYPQCIRIGRRGGGPCHRRSSCSVRGCPARSRVAWRGTHNDRARRGHGCAFHHCC